MFDISFGELAILFALCLLVLGPEKLPKLASQLGRFAGQARAMARHFSAQLEQEVQHEQMLKELRESDAALSKVLAQARANPGEALLAAATASSTTDNSIDAKSGDEKSIDPEAHADAEAQADVAHSTFVHPAIQGGDPDFNIGGHSTPDAITPAAASPDSTLNKPAA
jgi:sec-independent protein translocase protein TatB